MSPTYVSCFILSALVTVAWYTTPLVRHIVRSGYGGLVHYSFSKAFARKRAFILHAAVAFFYVRVLVICFFFGEYRFVVCSDDTLNARHTTVAEF